MEFDIIHLPEEMREKIYSYCWASDLLNLACCSKTHYDCVINVLWEAVRIPWSHVGNRSLVASKELDYLGFTSQIIFCCEVNDHIPCMEENTPERNKELMETYKLILDNCNPEKLEKLHFNWSTMYPYMIELPCRLFRKTLGELTFRYLHSIDNIWKNISNLHALKKITIEDCTFNDSDIKQIATMKSLREIKLIWNLGLPADGIEQISKLKGLRKIAFNGNDLDFMNTSAFKHLCNLNKITNLSLEFSSVDDEILILLCNNLKLLENLSIAGCKQITNLSIHNLSVHSLALKSLNFSHTYITDTGLADVHKLKKLQKLYMRNTTITDMGVGFLNRSTTLRLIDLSYTLITYKSLKHLEKLTSLKYLSINATNITQEEISAFRQLRSFRTLYVSGPQTMI